MSWVSDPTDKDRIEYVLPPVARLDDVAIPIHAGGDEAAHLHVEEIIVRKLASFGIPARSSAATPGPVVTQYEVQPARTSRSAGSRARRRPGDGARGPLAPDRGADPGQERGRHRDPEQGLQRRRPAPDPRGASTSRRPARP